MKTKHLFEAEERSIRTEMGQQPEHIKGDFCCNEKNLTSLEGGPKSVSGGFYCHKNNLKSLQDAPTHVGGNFWCNNNQLQTLQHGPTHVGGNFWCDNNQLETLQGAPTQVGGHFWCHNNQLKSLECAPQRVGGNFSCHINPIESLHNVYKFVKKIDGRFYAPNATHLLGLMWIEGVKKIIIQDNDPVTDIMNKYLEERDLRKRLLLCQEELLDNGFDEQAQL